MSCRSSGAPQHRGQHGRNVVATHLAAPDVLTERHPAASGVVGQPARPHDREVEAALLQFPVGSSLGAQIDGEGVVALQVGVGAHRADHHVAADGPRLGRCDQLRGAAVVHRQLAVRAAARTGARSEHNGVGAVHGIGHLLVARGFEVANHRLAAGGADIAGVVRVADQGEDLVAAFAQQAGQAQGDLPVSSGDSDAHGWEAIDGGPAGRSRGAGA